MGASAVGMQEVEEMGAPTLQVRAFHISDVVTAVLRRNLELGTQGNQLNGIPGRHQPFLEEERRWVRSPLARFSVHLRVMGGCTQVPFTRW